MKEEMMFREMELVRSRTIEVLQATSEDIVDTMPGGFRNNIRWHFGHILTAQEGLTFGFARETMQIPKDYTDWFAKGTSPADWTTEPASLDQLHSLLAEQPKRIQQTFAGRLAEEVPQPFKLNTGLELGTMGQLLSFTLYHEGVHLGFINGLKRTIEGENHGN